MPQRTKYVYFNISGSQYVKITTANFNCKGWWACQQLQTDCLLNYWRMQFHHRDHYFHLTYFSVRLMLDFSVCFLSEVSRQNVRNNPSSYQIKAAVAAASGCGMASSSTCTSARRRVETLDWTAPTRAQLHVRRTHLDDGDNDDTCFLVSRTFLLLHLI